MCVAQQVPASIRHVAVQALPVSALDQTNGMGNPVLPTAFLSLMLFEEAASPSGSEETRHVVTR